MEESKMKDNLSLGFIGGGRVSYLLLEGLKRVGELPENIIVSDPNSDRMEIFKSIDARKIEFSEQNNDTLKSRIIFLAVHPPLLKEVLPQIQNNLPSESILISLAPVVNTTALKQMLGGFNRIVRMIPNAPSIIGQGYNPVCFQNSISAQEKSDLLTLFTTWGKCPEVDEDKLEAYAILTAMGPTYFWFQWLELQRLGAQFNLSGEEIYTSLNEMNLGASQLLFNSDYSPDEVLDMIPVKPLHEDEETIRHIINTRLSGLYSKLTEKK
jgi:pyrroline-5-carboxylate reductase